ncbi:MAG: hypothetical protein EON54_11760, partial [Alcaligenaceae bacterium]
MKTSTNLALRRSVSQALSHSSSPSGHYAHRLSSFSFTAIALILAQPGMAAVNCPPANSSTTTTTCTIQADQGGNGAA